MPQETEDQALITARANCRNCGNALDGEYCSKCGQRDRQVVRFFPTLVTEAFEGLFAFNSRTYKTIWYLLTRPAFLTNEYLSGRRVSYLPPMRLFLVFILVFIFTISLQLFLESISINLGDENSIPEFGNIETNLNTALNEITIETQSLTDDTSSTRGLTVNADNSELVEGVLEVIALIRIPYLSDTDNQRFIEVLQTQAQINIPAIQENPRDFASQLLEYVPILMLALMPLLALIQQLTYLRSKRFYVEHLVLTIHNHSFLFLAFILLFILDALASIDFALLTSFVNLLNNLISLWIVIYLFLSLKFFFNQGYTLTLLKFVVISIFYGACLTTGMLALTTFGFFTY